MPDHAGTEAALAASAHTAAGCIAAVTGDFKALTGDGPLPFEQWLTENKPALAGLAS